MTTEKHQCSAKVAYDNWGRTSPCERPGKVEVNGNWYCAIHDPAAVKKREEKATAKWNKEHNQRVADMVAGRACRAVNPDNPLAVAETIKEAFDALTALLSGVKSGGTQGWYGNPIMKPEAIEKGLAVLAKANKKGE